MKIYHVICNSNTHRTFYKEFVCFAESEYDARRIHPSGDSYAEFNKDQGYWTNPNNSGCDYPCCANRLWDWTDEIELLEVIELGKSTSNTSEVIIAKFCGDD